VGRRSSTDGVTAKGERIQIRFTWRGLDLRPTLEMRPTKTNLDAARRIRRSIEDEIRAGTFDLAHHFPGYRPPAVLVAAAPRQKTAHEAFETWVALRGARWKSSTRDTHLSNWTNHWKPQYGDGPVDAIDDVEVTTYLTGLGVAAKTWNNLLIPLRGACKTAARKGWARGNPVELVENLEPPEPEADPFDEEETRKILEGLRLRPHGEVVADYYEFAFFTGLRPSEQVGLDWADIDLPKRQMKIHHGVVWGRHEATTKTKKRRLVDLNDRAWGVIQRQRGRTQLAGGRVFWNPETGQGWANESKQYLRFVAVLKAAGIRHRKPYQTRATNITRYLMAGADPWWVASQHGHDYATMKKHYAGWVPERTNENLERINARLAGRVPVSQEAAS